MLLSRPPGENQTRCVFEVAHVAHTTCQFDCSGGRGMRRMSIVRLESTDRGRARPIRAYGRGGLQSLPLFPDQVGSD